MTRGKKAFFTSIASAAHQIIAIVYGFILPRLFLTNYGSAVNGLVASITQFLGFIALAELGVGTVVQSSLYKPLAEKNVEEISRIHKSCTRFFKKIGIILLIYSISLAFIYPFIVCEQFDYFYTLSLIIIISISTFAQYYVGMSYRLLLGADQYGFISETVACVALMLNTCLSIILIKLSFSIHIVKLVSSLVFLAQPLVLLYIGKKKYTIIRDVTLTEEPIKQKWNGLAQHLASVVLNNTDIVVLTLFSTLENVSVYSIYFTVVNGVKSIVYSFTAGYMAMFGNMLAKKEIEQANNVFDVFEWVIHTLTTLAFGLTGVLIIPFISVYTKGVTDYNYFFPSFGALLTAAFGSYCLRLPYNILVMAAGHYKQTQVSAIIEVIINVFVSILLVSRFGLIGVAIGTLSAMVFRTIYFAIYLSRNIINRKLHHFVFHCIVDAFSVIGMILCCQLIGDSVSTIWEWVLLAIKDGFLCLIIVIAVNLIFYRRQFVMLINRLLHRITA